MRGRWTGPVAHQTKLSRFRELFVIARNTMFTFKGQAVDVGVLADQLQVRYVVEGSIRRSGERIRVTAQLVDTEVGSHIWSERYDRRLDDVFELQDDITRRIVTEIAPEIAETEQVRAARRDFQDIQAWGCYQLGLGQASHTRAGITRAKALFRRAVEMDPSLAAAYFWLAHVLQWEVNLGLAANRESQIREARELVRQGLRLDSADAMGLVVSASLHATAGDADSALRDGNCRKRRAESPS